MSILRRRRISLLSVLALAVTACAAATQAVDTDSGATTSASERVVSAYIEAYNRHDIPGMLALADSAVVWLSIVGDSVQLETRGIAELRKGLEDYFTQLPSARSTVEGMMSLGPWVTVRERAHWQTAAGARSQAALAVYEVRDGRIRRVWYYPAVRSSE